MTIKNANIQVILKNNNFINNQNYIIWKKDKKLIYRYINSECEWSGMWKLIYCLKNIKTQKNRNQQLNIWEYWLLQWYNEKLVLKKTLFFLPVIPLIIPYIIIAIINNTLIQKLSNLLSFLLYISIPICIIYVFYILLKSNKKNYKLISIEPSKNNIIIYKYK
jgi:ABC-type bacteriocin/lantibiotic exporter with double-glycine peptidase domain